MSSVRVAAARALLAIGRRDTTMAAALERARAGLPDPRDRALLVELTAGTLRWQRALDAMIAHASGRDVEAIEERVRVVLRLGVYQLRYLERVPPHAVVHESVEAVRALGVARAAGLVNAVLRSVLRGAAARALPERPPPASSEDEQLAYLSVTLSHPRWLVRRWVHRYGFDATARWCAFNNAAPTVTVRPVPPATMREVLEALASQHVDASEARYAPRGIRLPPGALGRLSPTAAATVAVQDEGSQLVAAMAGAVPGERVIDLCAAPGGKTVLLAEDLALAVAGPAATAGPVPRSMLVASDYRSSRVRLLAALLRQRGVRVPVLTLDARTRLPFDPVFDCVLLDAPCSGLGTIRRDPDLKWARREDEQARFVADQRRMIRAAAAIVRPGGRLVYATCSSEPEENDGIVEEFLGQSEGTFVRGTAPETVPAAVVDQLGALRTLPFVHDLDAYFAVRLERV